MRDLHIVGVSDDGQYLLLGGQPDADRASSRLRVDDRLNAAVRGRLGRPGQGPAESALSPKEIQARLRAGQTPDQVARVAGVPVARVERYAGPVESERALMIEGARAAVLERARRGPSVVNLGEAVDVHLAATPGLRAESVQWSARRRDDGRWIVALSFLARGRAKTAEWSYDPAGRVVDALDATAATLGHVASDQPSTPRRSARSGSARSSRTGRRRSAGVKAAQARKRTTTKTAKRQPTKSVRTAKATKPAKRTTTRRAAPAKRTTTTTKRAAKTTRRTGKAPTARGARKATKSAATTRARRAAPARAAAPEPLTSGTRERGSGRASVPAWQDVLLGIRPAAPADGNGRAEANGGRRSAASPRSRRRS